MKLRSLILLAVTTAPFVAISQISDHVAKSTRGAFDRETIFLTDSESKVLDSVNVTAEFGKFEFKRELSEPILLKLKLKHSDRSVSLFVNGAATIQAEYLPAQDRIVNVKVSGSEEYAVYQKLLAAEAGGLTPDEIALMKKYIQEKDTAAMRVLKGKKRAQMEESFDRIFSIADANRDKHAVAYFIGSVRIAGAEQWLKDRLYKIYSILNEPVKQSEWGKKFMANYTKG